MISMIPRAPFARSLHLSFASRLTKLDTNTARGVLLMESKRAFITTGPVAQEAELAAREGTKKDKAPEGVEDAKTYLEFMEEILKEEKEARKKRKKRKNDFAMSTKAKVHKYKLARPIHFEHWSEVETVRAEYNKSLAESRSTSKTHEKSATTDGDAPWRGFSLFVKENWDESMTVDKPTWLAERWCEMSSSDQDEYKQRAKEIYEGRNKLYVINLDH